MPSSSRPRSLAPLLFALLGCAVACVAISSQSFWIDEAETALKAIQPTLGAWWQALYIEHNSNLQLPLYMLYAWGWARLFGVSELALHAANIPWFFLGLFAIAHSLRRQPGLRNAALLVYCLHPFVWYYLDEARPYLMQLSGALLVAGSLFTALDEPDQAHSSSWWWLFAAGLTILCGAGVLGHPKVVGVRVGEQERHGAGATTTRRAPATRSIASHRTFTTDPNLMRSSIGIAREAVEATCGEGDAEHGGLV